MLGANLEVAKLSQENALGQLAEKEMSYILMDLTSIATQASLIAGFTYSTIADEVTDSGEEHHESNLMQDVTIVGSNTLCIVVNLIAVISATLVMTSGPYHALMGDEETLWTTLRSLRKERTRCIRLYWWGLVTFFLSLILAIFFGPFNVNSRYVLFFLAGVGTIWAYQTKRRITHVFGGITVLDDPSMLRSGASRDTHAALDRTDITVVSDAADCPRCGTALLPSMPFCSGCGCRIRAACVRCKSPVDVKAPTCPQCGARTRFDQDRAVHWGERRPPAGAAGGGEERKFDQQRDHPGAAAAAGGGGGEQQQQQQRGPPMNSSSVFPILNRSAAARNHQVGGLPTATAVHTTVV